MQNILINSIFLAGLLTLVQCTGEKKVNPGNYFIGQIEYTYSYESSDLDPDSLTRIKPHKSIFRFDLNNYQSRFFGKDTFTYYYSGKLNKAIYKINNQLRADCEDYGLATDSVLFYKVYVADEKVSGQNCDILEFQSKFFHNKYWVSKELKIAPNTYKDHLAYNWSFYGEKAGGGIILKLEHRFKNYIMTGVVSEIKKYDQSFKALGNEEVRIKEICNDK